MLVKQLLRRGSSRPIPARSAPVALALASLVLAGHAGAQTRLGETLPRSTWTFAHGEPIEPTGDAAPACAVYAFYTRADHAPGFSTEGDYLTGLQRRFAERGVVVVAVVTDAKGAPVDRWPGCRIAVDPELTTTNAWLTDTEGAWHVVVARQGKAVFLGRPDAGLVDAVETACRGKDAVAAERMAFSLRHDLPLTFDDATADVVDSLRAATRHAPRDGLCLGLLYLALATKANDAEGAAAVLAAAL